MRVPPGRFCSAISAAFLCLSVAGSSAAEKEMTFNLPPRRLTRDDRLVAAAFFHWFTWHEGCAHWPPPASCGQASGLWPPLEGREQWTGQADFFVRQIKDVMSANIDILYVHLYPGMEEQRINLFAALSRLRRQGYEVPKVVPFLDPALTWDKDQNPVDLAMPAGKDDWAKQYIRFFNQYFSKNPDPQADGFLGVMDGKVMLNAWLMGHTKNYDRLTRSDVENRLAAAFADKHPVFKKGVYQISSPAFSEDAEYLRWSDQLDRQFATPGYFTASNKPGYVGGYTVKPGVSNQNIVEPGYYLPRHGGKEYRAAWQKVLADGAEMKRVFIESWNEYDESSGIYAARPGPPFISPRNRSGNTPDVWSATGNPREYIDTTHQCAAKFNRLPANAARCLGHTIPQKMAPGQAAEACIAVRNEGNDKWSNARGYQLSAQAAPFCPATIPINDADPADEIKMFGGIFRGRPKLFRVKLTAPDQPGLYDLYFQMRQDGAGRFGDNLHVQIKVG